MAFSKQFEVILDDLFRQRTHWLRSLGGMVKPGKPPEFDRQKVNSGIEQLQQIASDAFSHKLAKKEFKKLKIKGRNHHITGFGRDVKRKNFDNWYNENFDNSISCIYCFWGTDGKCLYVGRTGSGGNRPSSHFEKYWFSQAKRIRIFQVKSKSETPKIECLAIHYFQPKYNKNKASTRAWTKACPLCEIHHEIEDELRKIFRFR